MLGVSMLFMPESPAYLVSKGKEDRARKALNWLRGPEGPDPEKELEDLRAAQKQREAIGSVTVKELLTLSEYLKPLGVALVLMFFQQFAGINVVVFYTQEIFADAGSDMDPGLSARPGGGRSGGHRHRRPFRQARPPALLRAGLVPIPNPPRLLLPPAGEPLLLPPRAGGGPRLAAARLPNLLRHRVLGRPGRAPLAHKRRDSPTG